MTLSLKWDSSSVFVIGIAGGSGSGKTTLARQIQASLSETWCGWLAQDRYYKGHGPQQHGMNYDHPDAIEFDLLARHLEGLKKRQDVQIPQYDFISHVRMKELSVFPSRPIILVDGTLLLTQPQIRQHFNWSFFIEVSEAVRFQRRLFRDVRERGRTPENVREQFYSQVKPMHDQFVEPSKKFASQVISGETSFEPIVKDIVAQLRPPTR